MRNITSIITLALLVVSCVSTAVVPVSVDAVSKQVEVNASKAELYVRANAWMIESFRDARSVIQFSDKEEGEIIGRYFLHNTVGQMKAIGLSHVYHDPQSVFAIIRIRVKDGLAKIIITPDAYRTRTGTVNNDFTYPEESLRKDIEQLLSDFTEYMNQDPGRF